MFCVCMGACGYPRKYMTISFRSVKVMVWKTIIRTFVLFLVRHVFSGVTDHDVNNKINAKTGAGGDPSWPNLTWQPWGLRDKVRWVPRATPTLLTLQHTHLLYVQYTNLPTAFHEHTYHSLFAPIYPMYSAQTFLYSIPSLHTHTYLTIKHSHTPLWHLPYV